jgi:orotidine-5'-phosphate decarboxylase
MSVPPKTATAPTARDRLIFALDYPTAEAALAAVSRLRGRVGLFKLGLELFVAAGPDFVRRVAEAGGCPVFLDLKLHDIPATVAAATAAARRLPAAFLTVHADGAAILDSAVRAAGDQLGILAVTVLTSLSEADLARAGGLGAATLEEIVLRRATLARETGCAGLVCSGHELAAIRQHVGRGLIVVAAGIRPSWSAVAGDDQRRQVEPAAAVAAGADYLVVGRPIRNAPDPAAAADRIVTEIESALRAAR